MLEAFNNVVLLLTDPFLNWLLHLPRELAIFIVAILTSLALTFSRKWVTDQEWLRRADADAKRLKTLIREAKARRDKEAAKRYKTSMGEIKLRSLKYEGKPLLVAILPILLLATWGFNRLGCFPPQEGETVAIKMYVPRGGIDGVVHILPLPEVEAQNGWVQQIVLDTYPEPASRWEEVTGGIAEWLNIRPPLGGVATWKLQAPARREPYVLRMVYNGEIYEKDFTVGQKTYAAQAVLVDMDGPVQATEQMLRQVRMFGVIGGFGPFFPPWLVAYLLIAIPFVSILKRTCKIY